MDYWCEAVAGSETVLVLGLIAFNAMEADNC
jgi:hypothetical protein